MDWPAAVRTGAAHSLIVPAASTVILPPVFCAPTPVPVSTRSTRRLPVDRSVMSSLSATLWTSRTSRSPPARTEMLPLRAEMRSTVRPVASLTRTSPVPLTSTVRVSTSVFNCTSRLARTVKSSAMKTEAPSVLTSSAFRRRCPPTPDCAAAATMPPRTVSLPPMSSVTSRAGSKPSSPPTKPLSVRGVDRSTKMSRRARNWKFSAGSVSTWMLTKPVTTGVPVSETVSRMSPSPL